MSKIVVDGYLISVSTKSTKTALGMGRELYFSQLFRYARICTNYIDFRNRCMLLSKKLIVRGFSANKLAWQFKKLCFKYNQLLQKYDKSYQDILNDIVR
jgi:hypothetical protein